MLNDSYWKEYNNGERAYLRSANGENIAYIQREETVWSCTIYPKLINESFYWKGITTLSELEWQMTLYIHNQCNKIANQLHSIRDHLPSIHELADRVFAECEQKADENKVDRREV